MAPSPGGGQNRRGRRGGATHPAAGNRAGMGTQLGNVMVCAQSNQRDYVELRGDSYNPEHQPIGIGLAKQILQIDGVAVGR